MASELQKPFNDILSDYPVFAQAMTAMDELIRTGTEHPELINWLHAITHADIDLKQQNDLEYQHQIPMVLRNYLNDRVFPLETVEIQSFNTKHDAAVQNATIHSGPAADEFARSLNAVALTIGNDIYFRNGSYKPESEEGRTILAHELTHVAQHQEHRIAESTTRDELEDEAIQEETKEQYDPDPVVPIQIGADTFYPRISQFHQIAVETASDINNWLSQMKNTLQDDEYTALLCKAKKWTQETL